MIEAKEYYKGRKYLTNSSGYATIVAYESSYKVLIEFEDNTRRYVRIGDLKRGQVKNLNKPSYKGVGYDTKVGVEVDTLLRSRWSTAIDRCYGKPNKNGKSDGYKGVTLCDAWLDYAEFYKYWKGKFVKDFEIDKDLLCVGNKVYSPEFCVMLPPEINKAIRVNRKSGSTLPLGITENGSGGYRAKTSFKGKESYSSTVTCPKEAFLWYKNFKETLAKSLAEKWRGKIEDRAYQALYNLEMTEKGWLTKEESAFKFYETGEVEIPEYYQSNLHLVGVNYE